MNIASASANIWAFIRTLDIDWSIWLLSLIVLGCAINRTPALPSEYVQKF